MNLDVAPSGIEKLDNALGGGFPRNGVTSIVGPTGIGKTILSLQWLAEGARNGENTIYISTTIPVERIKYYYGKMPFLGDVVDRIKWYDLFIEPKDLIPFTPQKQYRLFHNLMPDIIDENLHLLKAVDRGVFDSITTMEKIIGDPSMFRYIASQWIRFFNKEKITLLLIEEMEFGENSMGEMRNFSETTIVMDYLQNQNIYMRALKIVKRYGYNNPTYWMPFHIKETGIEL